MPLVTTPELGWARYLPLLTGRARMGAVRAHGRHEPRPFTAADGRQGQIGAVIGVASASAESIVTTSAVPPSTAAE